MADASAIGWTEATWNPTTGCDRISPGCDHCYEPLLGPLTGLNLNGIHWVIIGGESGPVPALATRTGSGA